MTSVTGVNDGKNYYGSYVSSSCNSGYCGNGYCADSAPVAPAPPAVPVDKPAEIKQASWLRTYLLGNGKFWQTQGAVGCLSSEPAPTGNENITPDNVDGGPAVIGDGGDKTYALEKDLFFDTISDRIGSGSAPIGTKSVGFESPSVAGKTIKVALGFVPEMLKPYLESQGIQIDANKAAALAQYPGLLDITQVEPRDDGSTLDIGVDGSPYVIINPAVFPPLPVYVGSYSIDDEIAGKNGEVKTVCTATDIIAEGDCTSQVLSLTDPASYAIRFPSSQLTASDQKDIVFKANISPLFDASSAIEGHRYIALMRAVRSVE